MRAVKRGGGEKARGRNSHMWLGEQHGGISAHNEY